MFQTDAGRTARTRPYSAATWPLVCKKQRLPRLGLSALNSMAFGLAVYASWSELPQYHAKLASSCWSGSTGRGSHPQGSDERFQICKLHLIPLSQALLGAIASTAELSSPAQLAEVQNTFEDASSSFNAVPPSRMRRLRALAEPIEPNSQRKTSAT
jgi:hypothetical protein